jgi:hypothetical protein
MQPWFLAIVLAATGCGRVGHATHPGTDGDVDGGQDGGRDAGGDGGHLAAVAADTGAPPPDARPDSGHHAAVAADTGAPPPDAGPDGGHHAAVAADTGTPPPDAGPDACSGSDCRKPESCQTGIRSIARMPAGTTTLDFHRCLGGCVCCQPGSIYGSPLTNECVTCSMDASLAAAGITRTGGSGTTLVDCITGNPAAPIGHQALFIGSAVPHSPGTYGVELRFATPVRHFGFSILPTASTGAVSLELRGYATDGSLVGHDKFTFTTAGGDCATWNRAARFFGFQTCFGGIVRVVVSVTDPNTAIDSISYFRGSSYQQPRR